jgi:hypothetical protein
MGGQPSKVNRLDTLQDSRDAMRIKDENHLAKEGSNKKLEYVPRDEPNLASQRQRNITDKNKRPSFIVCTESN